MTMRATGVGVAIAWAVLMQGAASLFAAPLTPETPAQIQPEALGQSASHEPQTVELTLLYTSDNAGEFAPMGCGAGVPSAGVPSAGVPSGEVTAVHTLAALRVFKAGLASRGAPAPIVVDAGDLLGHGAFLRYALSQGAEGRALVTDLVAGMGYDALAIGNGELSIPPSLTAPLFAELDAAGARYGAVNLTCDAKLSPLCAHFRTGFDAVRVVRRAGVRVAIVPVSTHRIPKWVDAAHVIGLTFGDEDAAASKAVARIRKEGLADIIVVIAHAESSSTSPREALKLARAVPQANVVVSNSFAREDEPDASVGAIVLQGGRPIVVGAPLSPGSVGRLRLLVSREPGGAVTVATEPVIQAQRAVVDEGLAHRVDALQASYCRQWGRPIGHARLAESTDDEGVLALSMNIMRQSVHADIALFNREGLGLPAHATVSGPLTRDRLFRWFPYDDKLYVATIKGSEIATLMGAVLPPSGPSRGPGLHVLGVVRDGDGFRVNGRSLAAGERYRVVTVDFLARGGDGALAPLGDVSWEAARDRDAVDATIRGVVERFFAEDEQREVGDEQDAVVPGQVFDDLWTRPRWTLLSDINGTLAQVALSNPRGYDDPQLSRQETLSLSATARLRAEMDARDHGWVSQVDLRYSGASIAGEDLSETEDLVTFSTLYRWLQLRNGFGRPRVYVPVPYARLALETEFSVPAERSDRHLQGTMDTGLEWVLTDTLTASVGYGLRRQIIQDDTFHHGLMFRYELTRTELFSLFKAPVYFESRFELFYSDLGTSDVLKGSGLNRLALNLFGPLNITVQHSLFLYREKDLTVGVSSDLQVGIQIYLDTFIQSF